MKKITQVILLLSCFFNASCSADDEKNEKQVWQEMDKGFHIIQLEMPIKSKVGNSQVTIVRIDPKLYKLEFLTAKGQKHENIDAKEWSEKYKLLAVINAGMFYKDHTSHVGYAKNAKTVNQAKKHKDYESVVAFNPSAKNVVPYKIFDLDKKVDFEKDISNKYACVIQNLRLIKSPRENRWPQQKKQWSEAAIGEDKHGNILFIHCKSPYSMHDFNECLLKLPIDIVSAQHLEGGPEASLVVNHPKKKLFLNGSYETDFNEDDDNQRLWVLPNVIGVMKR